MTFEFTIILSVGICILLKTSDAQVGSANGADGNVTFDTTALPSGLKTKRTVTSDKSQEGSWYPTLNATCENGEVRLTTNPLCVAGKLQQTKKECQDTFKTSDNGRGCVTSTREINCTAEKVCSPWSKWENKTNCCLQEKCDFNGITYYKGQRVSGRTRTCDKEIGNNCNLMSRNVPCIIITGRNFPSNVGNPKDQPSSSPSGRSNSIRGIAFGLAGMVMVGLLLFAAIRIRKATLQKRDLTERRDRDVEGVDNEALATMPSDSRVHEILNRMNANGRHYELRERNDSTPGRRVYVISPTGDQSNHMGPRGRVFSRATSQLSSIAEESNEDALSHITEATEPLDEERVFKYDSDTINGLENNQLDSAFEEDERNPKPASSFEAINCINDVLAMYDVDNDSTNDIHEILNRNSVISQSDYRKSSEVKADDYLSGFGWKPQERSWTIEKLKDENSSKTNDRRLSISCSTLNSMYSSNISIESTDAAAEVEEDHFKPLLDNDHSMKSSNLESMKVFSSMPSVLDTSQIPEIEEMLGVNLGNRDCDVTDSGVVHA